MGYTLPQCEEANREQHAMLMECLSPDEQHKLKMIRENSENDEKTLRATMLDAWGLFDDLVKDPMLRASPGLVERVKTEAGARVRHYILNNHQFKV